MRAALLAVGLVAATAAGVAWLVRLPAPRPPAMLRLVEHLSEARRAVQPEALLEPEVLHLQPGSLAVPDGWRAAAPAPGEVAHLTADPPRALSLRVDVPVTQPGSDQIVRAVLRDPSGTARLYVQHTPNADQAAPGWHRATDERSGARAAFDWREETTPEQRVLPLLLAGERLSDVVVESLTVHAAGARDPALVEGAPGARLHGLVERPIAGLAPGARGPRRVLASLLAAGGGVYEWAAPRAYDELAVETAVLPGGGVPVTLRVEVDTAAGPRALAEVVRGGDGDDGAWRPLRVDLPAAARALRLTTTSGPGRSAVVAWGNPTLREHAPPHPPHVLLITLDAVRPDHLSAYGYVRPTSPFLAKLAAAGARFDDVLAQRAHTWASTTSLVTGLFPGTSGALARGDRPHRGTRGWVDAFAAAGYTTVRIGSPDLPRGQLAGFDDSEIAEYDREIVERLSAVAGAAADRPLLIWLHISTAHYPWRVAPEFDRFEAGYHGAFSGGLSRDEMRAVVDAPSLPAPLAAHLTALYDAAILQMDTRLGAALAALDDSGFFANGVVMISADHGAHFGEHDVWFLHSTPWRTALRVPLILWAPGRVPAGVVARGRALLVDVGPTLLDLVGLKADGLDGASLRPLWDGAALPPRTVVTQFDPAGYLRVDDDQWTLLWNPRGEPIAWPGEFARTVPLPPVALFDRRADPEELHDLSAGRPDVVRALSQAAAQAQSRDRGTLHLSTEARQLLQQAGYAGQD